MNQISSRPPRERSRARQTQNGVIMLFGLIALAIMLIGAAAMVRSMGTSMLNAGNLGFKRDLTNQGERAVASVMTLLQTGPLNTDLARQSSNVAQNYSATMLATNEQGLPDALLSDSTFSSAGVSANDITDELWLDELCGNAALNGVPVELSLAPSNPAPPPDAPQDA